MICNPFSLSGGRTMDRTPPPVSLAAALALPRTPGRSAEVFTDGDLEVRFAAHPTDGPQVPHQKDEIYFVAAGTARYRVEDRVTGVGPGTCCSVPPCSARVRRHLGGFLGLGAVLRPFETNAIHAARAVRISSYTSSVASCIARTVGTDARAL